MNIEHKKEGYMCLFESTCKCIPKYKEEMKPDPKPGDVFGLWSFTGKVRKDLSYTKIYECRCVCGNITWHKKSALLIMQMSGCRKCGAKKRSN